jgi:hypothetical protein
VLRAVPGGHRQGGRIRVDRDHPGAEGRGDHRHRQPDASAAEDRQPLAGTHVADRGDRPVGGGEPAAQGGSGVEADILRQRDQVDLGVRDRHVLSERAPVVEARLQLPGADLLVAVPALLATAAGTDERHDHPLARLPAAHVRGDLDDSGGQFVAGHVRQRDVGIVTLPAVPVTAAQAGGLDLKDHPAGGHCRLGHLGDDRFGGESLDQDCAHGRILTPCPTWSGGRYLGTPGCRYKLPAVISPVS